MSKVLVIGHKSSNMNHLVSGTLFVVLSFSWNFLNVFSPPKRRDWRTAGRGVTTMDHR